LINWVIGLKDSFKIQLKQVKDSLINSDPFLGWAIRQICFNNWHQSWL